MRDSRGFGDPRQEFLGQPAFRPLLSKAVVEFAGVLASFVSEGTLENPSILTGREKVLKWVQIQPPRV